MSPKQSEPALSLRAMPGVGHACAGGRRPQRAGCRGASPWAGIGGPARLAPHNAHPHVTALRAVATGAETPP